ncbi:hypothetical protein [uncultured Fibrella sp.]|uniref:hypothetical protein n=1 Tax=uncultured Fibrella sp. TaxID=1284596 RepID=UPI0035CA36D7
MATKNEKALEQVEKEIKEVPAGDKADNGPTHGSNQPGRNANTHKSSKSGKGSHSAGGSTGGSKGGHGNS